MFNPDGAVVVVTGGASGIGKAFCETFAKLGAAAVIVVDLNLDDAKACAAALPKGVGVAMRANCGVEMDLRRVIMATEFDHGAIDAWISNAGIPSNGGPEVPNDEWDRIWQVNVMQHVYTSRHLFPIWEKRGQGSFLITASAAGLLTQIGSLPYSVTKHAAVAVAEWLQITYKETGIRVSCLCPQAVKTGMMRDVDSPGIASGDGVIEPTAVAEQSIDIMRKGDFLVLPHKEVKKYFGFKAMNYDRWLNGMQKLQKQFGSIIRSSPPISAAKL